MNEPINPNPPTGGDKPRLTDIAGRAIAPGGPAEAKRGRGRPPGSGIKPAGPDMGNAPAIPAAVWNSANVGALVRLPYSTAAFVTGIEEIKLDSAEEAMIIPAAVEVFNQFAPLAAAKYAALIACSAAVLAVSGSKWAIYSAEMKKRRAAEAERAKQEGK